ncbi:hypothetical protein CFT85387_06465 [Campylobacter fetus subsp. testudinum]|uniref:hypothetical protein n=1 Tax=Campylobacter fetus TaxID=196 RepID=UPI0008189254|nr:hypothetical protein [Campylobacter fetus]OCR95816.1 hypothetical protein CFT12S02847_06725 [Campylobacter fetus subsp. testudinum]OCS00355.1 hypothetical protein CFT85387_06465 [Campylobacter fetus subsp. testudinum]
MSDLELINQEILDLKDNVLGAIDKLEQILNSQDLLNVEKFYIKFICENNKLSISKISKLLKQTNLNEKNISEIKNSINILQIHNITNLDKKAIEKTKENIARQIELLEIQQGLLEKEEKANSFEESKRLKNTFLENEILLYEKSRFYTKESASFHLTNISLFYLLKLWNFMPKHLLGSSAVFIFIEFASVSPYFWIENLPIAEVSSNYLVYAGICVFVIFLYIFLFLMPYLYSNFYLCKINVKNTILVKRISSSAIFGIMIFFLALNNLPSLPKKFSEFLEQNIKIIIFISDNIIILLYAYMIGYALIAIICLFKKEITAIVLIYIAFILEFFYFMIFIKNPTFSVFLSFFILVLFNFALSKESKFNYKISIVLGAFFAGSSFSIAAPNIARIIHIANYHDDFWIENKFIIDLNITADKYMCKDEAQSKDQNETKKDENIEQEDVFNKQIYTCISYIDENKTKFKNLIVRTKTDDRYYLRAEFKENNESAKKFDFIIPKK